MASDCIYNLFYHEPLLTNTGLLSDHEISNGVQINIDSIIEQEVRLNKDFKMPSDFYITLSYDKSARTLLYLGYEANWNCKVLHLGNTNEENIATTIFENYATLYAKYYIQSPDGQT